MKAIHFNIIKLTCCLVIGVFIGYKITLTFTLLFYVITSLYTALVIIYLVGKTYFRPKIQFGILIYTTTIALGVLTVKLHEQTRFKSHYTQHKQILKEQPVTFTFKIKEYLKPSAFYKKYIVNIIRIDDKKVTGKLLVKLVKEDDLKGLKPDYIYTCKAVIKTISQAKNPSSFNYKNYLARQYVYHEVTSSTKQLLKTKYATKNIFNTALKIREYIGLKLNSYHFNSTQKSIIHALFLGEKQTIDPALYVQYSNAGIVHILSISGLHMGAIVLLLNFVLGKLIHFKNKPYFKTLFIILFLWGFAFITGLSASVIRAATMFSIISIGTNLQRPTHSINTVATSMFILLLIKPLFLLDLGFQLSYCAVIAIIIINPILQDLWHPKYRIARYYWQIFTVSFAAQLGVLPLCLYYFNKISLLFVISNLVIVPFLLGLLALGFLVITLALLHSLPEALVLLLKYSIDLLNSIVAHIASWDTFIINNVPFNLFNLVCWYIVLISCVLLWTKFNAKNIKAVLLTVILLQTYAVFNKIAKPSRTFIVFHKNKSTVIGCINKDSITTVATYTKKTIDPLVKNYQLKNNITHIKSSSIKHLYTHKQSTILVIDSLASYQLNKLKPDYILLRQSPKVNLERVINTLQPKGIIADGSNYKSMVKYWKPICKKRKLHFHFTGKNGAFILDN